MSSVLAINPILPVAGLALPVLSLPMEPPPGFSARSATPRWSWACRILPPGDTQVVSPSVGYIPSAGDLAVVEVEEMGYHERITTQDNLRLRIYPGDRIVGVFGNRYATDAYEGEVDGIENLSLLTAGGMIGTVRSRHRSVKRPTRVKFIGYLADPTGKIVNLTDLAFRKTQPARAPRNLVAVVGTGMNAGKTTSCVKLIKALSQQGLRVAACKLTGSVSNRDQDEMRSASAVQVLDFSDYGFPSTYLSAKNELIDLFHTMMAGLESSNADVTIMEIADGILQRETAMLLEDPTIKQHLSGVVLAADNALSAHYALSRLEALGHHVLAVTGLLTSSPLCMREFAELSPVTVASSVGDANGLGEAVTAALGLGRASAASVA